MSFDFSSLRQTPQEREPIRAVFAWWATLPPGLRPHCTARSFPHVVNQIALHWHDPVECAHYLGGLMFDTRRHSRAGFPPEVAGELVQLFNHRTGPAADGAGQTVRAAAPLAAL